MPDLAAGDYRLRLDPQRGGSVARFDWRGEPLFRPVCGPSILDTACFPLVPFSNRIAFGKFESGTGTVRLAPNLPGASQPHALHGFGWLAPWTVADHSPFHAVLHHSHAADEWPWDYSARQSFVLSEAGLEHSLVLTNLGPGPMPAGIGFHPYFPRGSDTVYRGLHCGEWQLDQDSLPQALNLRPGPVDWWHGEPVGTRTVDTVYQGREGELSITWPCRGLRLAINPSGNLPCTVVYTPPGEDYFCVEPVSHATDAINRAGEMRILEPGESLNASVHYRAMIAEWAA